MDEHYKAQIASEFRNCVNGTINRIMGGEQTYRPFHTALLSEDVVFWSAFERSFSTSFGQRVIEEIARLVALSNGATQAKRQIETIVRLDVACEEAIHNEMRLLRSRNHDADYTWDATVRRIRSVLPIGQTVDIRIISDLWWHKDGIDHYISLKTVKPNIDQTAVAKEDCLHLAVADERCKPYFGLPYNPYGESKLDYAHNPPMGIFDFRHDPVVLIGKELWDAIGGDGCYEQLLKIAAQVGEETRERINRLRS